MKVIHLLRKPLSEKTVAANTTKHGVGGLNIDASRIEGPAWTWGTQTDIRGGGYGSKRPSDGDVFATNVQSNPKGRWPANLILQHLDGCQCAGAKKVKGSPKPYVRNTEVKNRVYGKGAGLQEKGYQTTNYGDSEGTETVANWICEPGCPVRSLDEQSGDRPSTGNHPSSATKGSIFRPNQGAYQKQGPLYSDTGGASRFFKQVGGSKK